jgi:hypothetical protein
MTLGTILWGKFCCTNLFSKEPKNLAIRTIFWDVQNSGLYNPVRNPVGVNRRNVVLQMAKGNIIRKEKRLQSLPLLLILNWKAIEKDQQLISESTFVIT